MGHCYSHLSLSERIEIYHLHANQTSVRAIASALNRSPATISRELRRNSKATKSYAGGYEAARAHGLAERRRRWDARFKLQRQPALRTYVRNRLAMGWSPQQIAGRLTEEHAVMQISHESIYRFIYHRSAQKDHWHRLLPKRKHRRGRLKRGGLGSVDFIRQRRSLGERSPAADRRCEPGHWEADLMSFAKYGHHVLVLHERLSRRLHITRLASKKAAHVAAKIAAILRSMPTHLRRSVTFDNGTEFSHHYKLHDALGVQTFFCDPYAPWQKGGVENAIGRIRRWLPRKTDLTTLSDTKMRKAVKAYNTTPRKCLRYKTPNEIFKRVALQT
jgi:IS30 family transposase